MLCSAQTVGFLPTYLVNIHTTAVLTLVELSVVFSTPLDHRVLLGFGAFPTGTPTSIGRRERRAMLELLGGKSSRGGGLSELPIFVSERRKEEKSGQYYNPVLVYIHTWYTPTSSRVLPDIATGGLCCGSSSGSCGRRASCTPPPRPYA